MLTNALAPWVTVPPNITKFSLLLPISPAKLSKLTLEPAALILNSVKLLLKLAPELDNCWNTVNVLSKYPVNIPSMLPIPGIALTISVNVPVPSPNAFIRLTPTLACAVVRQHRHARRLGAALEPAGERAAGEGEDDGHGLLAPDEDLLALLEAVVVRPLELVLTELHDLRHELIQPVLALDDLDVVRDD